MMRWMALALLGLAGGAAYMAAPEWGAATWNDDVRRGCAEIRALRPTAACPDPKPETWATDWLLIAAVFCVGAAVLLGINRRQR
jgi:hypothetical protein